MTVFVSSCANCRFSRMQPGELGDGRIECHRYSPRGGWPLLDPTDWCGDWEADDPSRQFLGAHGGRIIDGPRAKPRGGEGPM